MDWRFEHTYASQVEGLYVNAHPIPVPDPGLVFVNDDLADELSLDAARLREPDALALFAGNAVPPTGHPLAQAYAGHQFGHFVPLLGDGRAHLLGELRDAHGTLRDVALKGSGRTPFSRSGDGRAALGPVLREALLGESMHALGIPTTRALAVVTSGQTIARDRPLPGAILTRVAASHLRIGTIELFRGRGAPEDLSRLVDYARRRHFPQIDPNDPLAFLEAVASRVADLIAAWMSVGFVHGVMNTDNMALSGETLDFGPCAFLDAYDPDATFSSIDTAGRYRFGHQPAIAQWNLTRLAECLLPLVPGDPEDAVAAASGILDGWVDPFAAAHPRRFAAKLGLPGPSALPGASGLGGSSGLPGASGLGRSSGLPGASDHRAEDANLVQSLLDLMQAESLDFTGTFRDLARDLRASATPAADLRASATPAADPRASATRAAGLRDAAPRSGPYAAWRARWLARVGGADPRAIAAAMDAVNPAYIPRNHLVEEALAAATDGDLAPFEVLLAAVRDPFNERAGLQRHTLPAPSSFTQTYVTYCGT